MGKKPDSYGDLLVLILLDKLHSDLRASINRTHGKTEWTLDQLINVLKHEICVLESGSEKNLLAKDNSPRITGNLKLAAKIPSLIQMCDKTHASSAMDHMPPTNV